MGPLVLQVTVILHLSLPCGLAKASRVVPRSLPLLPLWARWFRRLWSSCKRPLPPPCIPLVGQLRAKASRFGLRASGPPPPPPGKMAARRPEPYIHVFLYANASHNRTFSLWWLLERKKERKGKPSPSALQRTRRGRATCWCSAGNEGMTRINHPTGGFL